MATSTNETEGEHKMNNELATKWADFYADTISTDMEYDLRPGNNTNGDIRKLTRWLEKNPQLIADDSVKFGNVMAELVERDGKIDSGLWDCVEPTGTEDRTWCRAYAALMGYIGYENTMSIRNMDCGGTWNATQKMLSTDIFYAQLTGRKANW